MLVGGSYCSLYQHGLYRVCGEVTMQNNESTHVLGVFLAADGLRAVVIDSSGRATRFSFEHAIEAPQHEWTVQQVRLCSLVLLVFF